MILKLLNIYSKSNYFEIDTDNYKSRIKTFLTDKNPISDIGGFQIPLIDKNERKTLILPMPDKLEILNSYATYMNLKSEENYNVLNCGDVLSAYLDCLRFDVTGRVQIVRYYAASNTYIPIQRIHKHDDVYKIILNIPIVECYNYDYFLKNFKSRKKLNNFRNCHNRIKNLYKPYIPIVSINNNLTIEYMKIYDIKKPLPIIQKKTLKNLLKPIVED